MQAYAGIFSIYLHYATRIVYISPFLFWRVRLDNHKNLGGI